MKLPLCLAVIVASGGCTVLDEFSRLQDPATADGGVDAGTVADAADSGQVALKLVPADILFVIDGSGSIADDQENLAANFHRFVGEVAGTGDYRLAIISSDMAEFGGEQAGTARFVYAATYPFQLVWVGREDCRPAGIEHACFRGPEPGKRVVASTMSREEQISSFQANIAIGSCGSGLERGLDAMLASLAKTAAGQCNEGFLRPGANLVIVFVADEDDAGTLPITHYVEQLASLKPLAQVRVAVIGGVDAGQASNCGIGVGAACGSLCNDPRPVGSGTSCTPGPVTTCPAGEYCSGQGEICEAQAAQFWPQCDWCSYYDAPGCCSAYASQRYVDFARAIEAEVAKERPEFPVKGCVGLGHRVSCLVDTICQNDFGDTLVRLARELVLSN